MQSALRGYDLQNGKAGSSIQGALKAGGHGVFTRDEIDDLIRRGQKHQIFFKGNQLRSPNAEFDPAKVDSSNLLSGIQPTRSALAGIA